MRVSDETKLFVIRQKLLEAERSIYEANKIIANLGEFSQEPITLTRRSDVPNCNSGLDPITGLYPGQKPNIEDDRECIS